ncbi:MAG TPA: hypothetical protein VK988_17455, partial [Acidimicrobiales bacterium]|nr:hypothetical protein [Acidimicrobiales bacterium]
AEAQARPDGNPPPGLLAACADWEGWACFLLDDHDKAIEDLHRSIRLEPTPEAYCHLARVYASRALDGNSFGERKRDATRARHYADLAVGLGLGARQAKPLEDALRRLDAERADEREPAPQEAQPHKVGV